MVSQITLKRGVILDVNFGLAVQDVVFHCSDGLVTANSLLLAVISPSVRRLLESRREQEEQFHLSCPGLQAAHLTCFLSDVYAGEKDINIPEDVDGFIFPEKYTDFFKKVAVEEFVKEEPYDVDVKDTIMEYFPSSDQEEEEPTGEYENVTLATYENIAFVKRKGRKEHNRMKMQLYCFVCDIHFRCQKRILDHLKRKHGPQNKPAKQLSKEAEQQICSVCGKSFTRKQNLKIHIQTQHTDMQNKIPRKKVTCQVCGKLVAHLNAHMSARHTEESDLNFECKTCGKRLGSLKNFNYHMNVHLNIKPFQCREGCDMAYRDVGNRNKHEKRVHGNWKGSRGGRLTKIVPTYEDENIGFKTE